MSRSANDDRSEAAGASRGADTSAASAAGLVEHFFRHESANLVAVLSRAFGIRRIDLIEDMVQAAMLEAMNAWKQRGVPENPAGWLHRVARNRILDALRKEGVHQKALAHSGQSLHASESLVETWLEEEQLPDSLLRMMFVCCHPEIQRDSQIALSLKILCGFAVVEIARALLLPAETVKKRIQRAKRRLAEANVSLDLPSPTELHQRIDVVHDALYLMFNEGYSTSQGHDPIRDDLCEEAARLCHLLCQNAQGTAETRALLALMLFHSSRLESRVDSEGAVVLLEDQDRTQWNQDLINAGEYWLRKSGKPDSRFHYEAMIAWIHCRADSVENTDWETISQVYDTLILRFPSPVYHLNQAIAMAQAGDLDKAMRQLDQLRSEGRLKNYFLLDCARARVEELRGNGSAAIDCYLDAITRGLAPHEESLIKKKIQQLS